MGLFDKSSNRQVTVRQGRHIEVFTGNRIKSTLYQLEVSQNDVDQIVKTVHQRLSSMSQPVKPFDIATTTHVVMVEMGLKDKGDQYIKFVTERAAARDARPDIHVKHTVESKSDVQVDVKHTVNIKIKKIKCGYCGGLNNIEAVKCEYCRAPFGDKDKVYTV